MLGHQFVELFGKGQGGGLVGEGMSLVVNLEVSIAHADRSQLALSVSARG